MMRTPAWIVVGCCLVIAALVATPSHATKCRGDCGTYTESYVFA